MKQTTNYQSKINGFKFFTKYQKCVTMSLFCIFVLIVFHHTHGHKVGHIVGQEIWSFKDIDQKMFDTIWFYNSDRDQNIWLE